jgi:hypothetical protein
VEFVRLLAVDGELGWSMAAEANADRGLGVRSQHPEGTDDLRRNIGFKLQKEQAGTSRPAVKWGDWVRRAMMRVVDEILARAGRDLIMHLNDRASQFMVIKMPSSDNASTSPAS